MTTREAAKEVTIEAAEKTAKGAAKCNNDEFPSDLSKFTHCTNPTYEAGTTGSCTFVQKITDN